MPQQAKVSKQKQKELEVAGLRHVAVWMREEMKAPS
jgi:hypothetical protein